MSDEHSIRKFHIRLLQRAIVLHQKGKQCEWGMREGGCGESGRILCTSFIENNFNLVSIKIRRSLVVIRTNSKYDWLNRHWNFEWIDCARLHRLGSVIQSFMLAIGLCLTFIYLTVFTVNTWFFSPLLTHPFSSSSHRARCLSLYFLYLCIRSLIYYVQHLYFLFINFSAQLLHSIIYFYFTVFACFPSLDFLLIFSLLSILFFHCRYCSVFDK